VASREKGWEESGGFIGWRGHRIFVRESGRGEALLLIHGFPTSSRDWRAIAPALEACRRVIAFDMIGFGLSAKPRGFDYRVAAQADLAEEVLRHFGVARCAILAHDLGDTVAQELLARQEEGRCAWALEGLCLLNGGLFPETHRAAPIQKLLASPLGPLFARFLSFGRFAATMNRICAVALPPAELEAMWTLMIRDGGARVMPRLLGYMAERRLHRERWVGALCRTQIPLRLAVGMDDPISGAHMARRYREIVPRADVVELAGVGHYPQLEAPAQVCQAALGFLRADDP
jgi:pimeloyl-ACP methyl ester carboxylesterase